MDVMDGQIQVEPSDNSPIQVTEVPSGAGWRALLKLLLLLAIFAGVGTASYLTVSRTVYAKRLEESQNQTLLISVPLKMTEWQDIGTVSEPSISLPIEVQSGYKQVTFLLDSGAVISSLPREMSTEMGQNLAFLKRTSFRGFGNQTSFAYNSSMKLKMGETEVILPVVFTESADTQPLLGRKGFFDEYSITFNHVMHTLEIRQ
jgi:hypothetical protein